MSEDKPTYVTLRDLDEKLAKLPSRWEVRFLILAGLIGSQLIPVNEAAQAALSILN